MGAIQYEIHIEIFESGGCAMHSAGEIYRYPADAGSICPWLLDSMSGMMRVLQFGGKLPWTYKGTKYSKLANTDKEIIEFVRCPDPTSAGVVARITARKMNQPVEVGWA
jgi:uncharacterized repeat protein (TIGR04076 family)